MMEIEFKRPELEDRERINQYFRMNRNRSCEYTFANLYLWSRHYKVQYAIVEDMLVFYYTEYGYFTFPQGDSANLKKVLELLMDWTREQGREFHLINVNAEQFLQLEKLYPGKFMVEYNRDAADYVYETERLIALSGKKYHGKKNHINKFQKTYPDWTYEKITPGNVEECFQMALSWRRENGCEEDENKNAEMCVTLNSLRLMEELELTGGMIRAGGKVVAFSIGEPVCDDTMVVHIEKAYAEVQGAYPMINQQFLLHEASEYKYVNREEDLGEPGLRRAKESYHPVFLLEKGLVSLR
ncbi:MAG: phosphatidylglycerol lysyltransferase domain-containing protein [Lachnospiraceae bacterium]|nr:phosphatidylglycerol lysyltransferase domain-containing protein [Lachnospiraceae bacterium]